MPVLLRVLGGFVAAYPQGLPALRAAWSAGDATGLGQACHSLRGACAAIGANALTQRLQALETEVEHQRPLPGLEPAVQQVQGDLVDLVQRLADALQP